MKRAIFAFVGCVVGMAIAATLLPGVYAESLEVTLWAGALLGGVYLVLRPVLRLLTLPLSFLTLGLIYIVLDAALLWYAVSQFDGISFATFLTAAGASFVVNASRSLFAGLAGKK